MLASADDDGTDNGFFLNVAGWRSVFDATGDDIANMSVAGAGAAENADNSKLFGATVVSNL